MEITIKGEPKEIADLVLAVQSRSIEKDSPLKVTKEAFHSAVLNFQKGEIVDE